MDIPASGHLDTSMLRRDMRGGYQVLWVNEVALASDQAQLTLNNLDVDSIDSSGNVFYHGALVGGEFTWQLLATRARSTVRSWPTCEPTAPIDEQPRF